jgi:uncharacterized ParB-like nuclease family protein
MTDISNSGASCISSPSASTREVLDHYRDLAVEESASLYKATSNALVSVEKALEHAARPSSAVEEVAETLSAIINVRIGQTEEVVCSAIKNRFPSAEVSFIRFPGEPKSQIDVKVYGKTYQFAFHGSFNIAGKSPLKPGETKANFFKRLLTRLGAK